jgi:hypothetical protein
MYRFTSNGISLQVGDRLRHYIPLFFCGLDSLEMLHSKFNEVWMLSLVLRTVVLSQGHFQFNRLLGSNRPASF